MPRNPARGMQLLQVEIPPSLIQQIRELAKDNSRPVRAEVEHALLRHLEAPPVLPALVTPELPPAVAYPETLAQTRKRRKGR